MYSILLVDDELLTLQYLELMIPQIDQSWSIAGTCSNGAEACTWLTKNRADLIITDIKMPEMNGLDFCTCVRQLYPEQKIIILSGYDDFQYARHAIRYGIKEYILKPISKTELKSVLQRMKELIIKDEEQAANYHSLLELSSEGKIQIIAKFIKAVISESNVEVKSLYPCLCRMKISLLDGPGILLLLSPDDNILLEHGIPVYDLPLFKYIVNQVAHDICKKHANMWTCLDSEENTVILISEEEENIFLTVQTVYSQIKDLVIRHSCISLSGGVSSVFSNVLQMNHAYKEASSALNQRLFKTYGCIHSFTDMNSIEVEHQRLLCQYSTSLSTYLVEKDLINMKSMITSFVNLIPQYTPHTTLSFGVFLIKSTTGGNFFWKPEDIENACVKLLQTTADNKADVISLYHSIALSLSASTAPDTEDAEKERSENAIVSTAKDYIDKNYSKPITLALLGEVTEVSPNYLSTIFHKVQKESYIKYLTRVRMEHAILLMKNYPELKIYEIVEKVGYISVKNFSYVFKQIYGISPGRFQQSL
ncbi:MULTISPECIES: response regulator transcription factor [Hungatella]|uniref:Stage 0 sporulation protein A homolog n=1 Tax=Hungatella hathewayi TaxID=154046 RepID=A0AAW9WM42_9FIRM|nr:MULTISPECIES: response regulator [Hungatella]MCI7381820.1 response regulator [Hungatella sp.]MCQ4830339.1 response regulator [Hungatella sp. SL.1.14]MDY6236781.1 response regulator [Hungatella hathewayi]MUB66456.1 response regulator [Hungatella hathewayi]CUQ52352.1 response regulator receiver protein [Hungatella hathewayi]